MSRFYACPVDQDWNQIAPWVPLKKNRDGRRIEGMRVRTAEWPAVTVKRTVESPGALVRDSRTRRVYFQSLDCAPQIRPGNSLRLDVVLPAGWPW